MFRTVLTALPRYAGRWFNDLTTSRDNHTPCFIRIGAILFGATYLGLSLYAIIGLHQTFTPSDWAEGAAALLAASGAAVLAKKWDERGA